MGIVQLGDLERGGREAAVDNNKPAMAKVHLVFHIHAGERASKKAQSHAPSS